MIKTTDVNRPAKTIPRPFKQLQKAQRRRRQAIARARAEAFDVKEKDDNRDGFDDKHRNQTSSHGFFRAGPDGPAPLTLAEANALRQLERDSKARQRELQQEQKNTEEEEEEEDGDDDNEDVKGKRGGIGVGKRNGQAHESISTDTIHEQESAACMEEDTDDRTERRPTAVKNDNDNCNEKHDVPFGTKTMTETPVSDKADPDHNELLYGIWQTEPYEPPSINADGTIPRNERGNVAIWDNDPRWVCHSSECCIVCLLWLLSFLSS